MEDLKEKMLCALKNNADKLRFNALQTKVGVVWIYRKPRYKVEEYRYFWFFKGKGTVEDGYKTTISLGNNKFEITEEEYEEIMKIREEKIKENQLKELTKLCNTTN